MNYIELNIPVGDPMTAEVLVAELGEWPFDSFVEEEGCLKAYIPAGALPDVKERVDALLASREITGARYIEIETQNWNAVWESQFDPIDVDGKLVIRAPFHTPSGDVPEIVIMPKMSFGTGHHATTWLMCAEMLEHSFVGKHVLDMGSGTGVLAILAAKLGAASVAAVDIDEWAYTNSVENIEMNGVGGVVRPIMGDVNAIAGARFDTVLANINRNILLSDMGAYAAALSEAGELIVSGILEADIETIERRAVGLGLWPSGQRIKDGWAVLSFRGCLNFPAESIFGSGRMIFDHTEGGIGRPTATEAGVKRAGSELKRQTDGNFKQPLRPAHPAPHHKSPSQRDLGGRLDDVAPAAFGEGNLAKRGGPQVSAEPEKSDRHEV